MVESELCGGSGEPPAAARGEQQFGCSAFKQLQLDVFGEVMDALHQARHFGLAASESGWAVELALLKHIERLWTEPDEGIWEIRGTLRHFTYSKVMAWVAFDRAIKSAEEFGLEGPVERWRRKSTTRCAGGASIRNLEALCSPTDRSSSTPACCSCPLSDSCRRMNRVCSAR